MAARSLSRTKPRDYRPALITMAHWYAKQAAKERIRALGHKVTDYLPKDITRFANMMLEADPEPYIAKARQRVAEWIAEDQARAHRPDLDLTR